MATRVSNLHAEPDEMGETAETCARLLCALQEAPSRVLRAQLAQQHPPARRVATAEDPAVDLGIFQCTAKLPRFLRGPAAQAQSRKATAA